MPQPSVASHKISLKVFGVFVFVFLFLGLSHNAEAANKYWSGSGTWNAANANWGTAPGGPYNTTFAAGDAAIFEGTAGTVTISAPNKPVSITFNVTGYTLSSGTVTANASPFAITLASGVSATISSIIAQTTVPTNVTVSMAAGNGTLTLGGANTFTGTVTINSGVTVKLGASSSVNTSSPLGTTGVVTVASGGALDFAGFSFTSSHTQAITINGTGISSGGAILNSSVTTSTIISPITFGTAASIVGGTGLIAITGTIPSGTTGITLGGAVGGSITTVIAGVRTVTKEGTGKWTLSGANTFSGGLTIKQGTFVAGVSNATTVSGAGGPSGNAITLGSSSGGSASLVTSGNFTVSNAINLGASAVGTLTIGTNGTISATAAPTFSGAIALGGNNLTLLKDGTSGNATFSGAITGTGNVTINNSSTGGTITKSTGTLNNTGTVTITESSTATSTMSAVIGSSVTTVSYNNSSTGGMTFSGANTFTGGFTLQRGIAIAGVSNATTVSGAFGPSGGAITLGSSSGGSASLLGNTFTVSNGITLGTSAVGTLTIGNNAGTTAPTFSGAINLNGNNLTISKTGTTGALTFSGGTTGTGNITVVNNATTATVVFSTTSVNHTGTFTNTGSATGSTTISAVVGTNVTGVVQNSATATLAFTTSSNLYTSGLTIKSGTVTGTIANSFGANGNVITIGDSAGSSNATLTGSANVIFPNPISIASGNSGVATISAASSTTFSGAITLNSHDLVISTNGSTGLTITGGITGTGNLTLSNLASSGNIQITTNPVNIVGTITNGNGGAGSTGASTISGGVGSNVTALIENSTTSAFTISTTFLTVNSGGTTLRNILGTALLTVSGGITGTGNLILDNDSATAAGVTLSTGAVNNIGTITNSGSGSGSVTISAVVATNVTGVVQNSSTALTLSGTNTFTSGLTIKSGTVNCNSTTAVCAGASSSVITIGDSAGGSNNASFMVGVTGLTYANPIVLASNTTGILSVGPNGSILATTFSGGVTGTNNLTISNPFGTVTFSTNPINNAGTVTNTGAGTATNITGGIGANVTEIIQNTTTATLTISTTPITVNSTSTTLRNSLGTALLTVSGGTTGTGNLIIDNDSATANGVTFSTSAINHTGAISNIGSGAGGETISVSFGSNITNVTQSSTTSSLTISSALAMSGNLTVVSSATFVAPAGNLTIGGDMTVDGTFTHSSGTVIFNGAGISQIDGNNTVFNNFTVATNNKVIKFKQGETVTFNGLLTLTGTTGNNVVLDSIDGSTNWTINHQGTESVNFVTVNHSTCDVASTTITNTNTTDGGTNLNAGCWGFIASFPITISGNVYSNEGSSLLTGTKTLTIQVNGAGSFAGTVTNGVYSVSGVNVSTAGDVITAYLDGNTEKAVTVSRIASTSSNITGFNLYQNYVIVRSEDGVNYPISNSNLNQYDSGQDVDINFTVTTGSLSVLNSNTLYVMGTNTNYTPGGDISTPAFKQVSGTFTGGAFALTDTGNFTLTGGTFVAPNASGSFTVSGSFTTSGAPTYTHNSGVLTMGGTLGSSTSIDASGVTFNQVSFNRTAGSGASLTLTIASGTTVPLGNSPTVTLVNTDGSAGYNLTNNGTITFGTGSATGTVDGTITNNNIISGSVTSISMNASITNGGTITLSSLATMDLNATGNAVGSFTNNASSSITTAASPTFNISGSLIVNSSSTFPTGVSLVMDGALSSNTSIDASGVTFGQVSFNRNPSVGSAVTLTIATGTTIPLGNSPTFSLSAIGGAYHLTNNGTITFGTGSTTSTVAGILTNNGTISGSITTINLTGSIDNSGTISLSSLTTLNLDNNGTNFATGSFTNNASSSITTAANPTFNISGSLIVNSSSTFPTGANIVMDGTYGASTSIDASGVTFNQVSFNRTASAGSAMTLTIASGTTIPLGNSPTVALASPVTAYHLTNNGTITVGTGTFTINLSGASASNFTNNGTLKTKTVTRTLTAGSFVNGASSVIEFQGDGDSLADTFSINTFATTYNSITFNAIDGTTDVFQPGASLTINGNITVTAGKFLDNSINLTGAGASDTFSVANGAIFELTGTSAYPASFTTYTYGTTSTVNYLQTNGATVLAGTYGDLNLKPAGATPLSLGTGAVNAAGNVVVGDGTNAGASGGTNNPTMSITGTLTVANGATLTLGNNTVTVSGATTVGSGSSGVINVAGAGSTGTYTFGDITVNSGGVFDLTTGTHPTSFNGNMVHNGTTFNTGTGVSTFTATKAISGASAMTFGGTTQTADDGVIITNNNTNVVTFSGSLLAAGAASEFDTGPNSYTKIAAGGVLGILKPSASPNTIEYTGSNPGCKPATTNNYYNLVFSGATGTISCSLTTVTGNVTVSGALTWSSSLTSVGGTLNLNAGTFTATSGTLTLGNGISLAGGAFTHNSGTVVVSGGNISATSITFNNLQTAGTVSAGTSAVTVAGNFSINSGTFTSTSGNLTIAGNFTDSGTFTHNSGTVIFNGAGISQIDGNNTVFNNFTVATNNKVIKFKQGETVTFNGLLTLTGTTGNNVVLDSIDGSTNWTINHQGTESVDYVTVSHSTCHASSTAITNTNTTSGGGNVGDCWGFGVLISGSSNASGTVAVAVNGILQSGKTGIIGGSAWSISGVDVNSGQVVTVWIDGAADAGESTAVAKYDGTGNMTGMVLDTNVLSLGSVDDQSISLSDLDTTGNGYDCTDDEDVMYSVASSTLSVEGTGCVGGANSYTNETLRVDSGDTFVLSGAENISTEKINVTTSGTLNAATTGTITLAGTGTPLTLAGTFTPSTSTVQYTGSTATVTGATFNNLTLGGTGTYTLPSADITLRGNLAITTGASVSKSASNKIVFAKGGGGTQTLTSNATNSDLGILQISANGGNTTLNLGSSVKATRMLVDNFQTLALNGSNTLTLTGVGVTTSRPFVAGVGALDPSTGTVEYVGDGDIDVEGAVSYHHLTLDPTITASRNYTVLGASSVGGNLMINPNASSGTPILTYNMGGTGNIVGSVTIQRQGANATSRLQTTSLNNYALSAGSISIQTGGSLIANGSTITITGAGASFVNNGGFFTYGTSHVVFTNPAVTLPAMPYHDLSITPPSTGSYTLGSGTLQSDGTLTIGDGTHSVTIDASANNPSFNVTGNVLIRPGTTFTKGSGIFTFNGGATQTLTDNTTSGQDLGKIVVSPNGLTPTTLQLGSNLVKATEVVVQSGQTLDLNNKTLQISKLVTASSDEPLQIPAGANLNGTVKFTSRCATPPCTITVPTAHYKGLTLSPGGSSVYKLGNGSRDNIIVDGVFTLGDGTNEFTVDMTTNDPDISSVSNLIINDKVTYQKGALGKVKLNKGTSQTWSDNNTVKQDIGHVQISNNGAGGNTSVSLGSDVKAEDVIIDSSQSLDLTGYKLTVTGNGSPIVKNGTLTLSTTTAPDVNGDTVTTGSTLEFAPDNTTGVTVPAWNYHHLKLNKAGNAFTAAAGTLQVAGNLDVTAGTLDLNTNDPTLTVSGTTTIDGTLDAPSSTTLTLGGDLTNNGTFNHNNSTVALVPASGVSALNINGSSDTTFYNLTANDSSLANKNINIKAGNTLNVTHNLTIGGSGETGSVILGSDTPGVQWTINVDSGATISLADIVVRDSACAPGSHNFSASSTIKNGGNNGDCWSFRSFKIVLPGFESNSGGGTARGGGGRGHGGSHSVVCSDATATATLSGDGVGNVSMESQGNCYNFTPEVFFCGGGGSGATGAAIVSGGSITGVNITSAGSGYTTAPTVIIPQSDGSGGGCPATGGGQGAGGGGGGGEAP